MSRITNKELDARITVMENNITAITELVNKQTVAINAQAKLLETLLEQGKDTKPAKKSGSNKSKSKNTKQPPVAPKAHFSKEKAKNGNGDVYWLKFDKPCNNEQYCLLKGLDWKAFQEGKWVPVKKSLWTYSRAYHALPSEQAKKQGEWFEKNYKPGTKEELAYREKVYNDYKANRNK